MEVAIESTKPKKPSGKGKGRSSLRPFGDYMFPTALRSMVLQFSSALRIGSTHTRSSREMREAYNKNARIPLFHRLSSKGNLPDRL
jgi:hypothetical protein